MKFLSFFSHYFLLFAPIGASLYLYTKDITKTSQFIVNVLVGYIFFRILLALYDFFNYLIYRVKKLYFNLLCKDEEIERLGLLNKSLLDQNDLLSGKIEEFENRQHVWQMSKSQMDSLKTEDLINLCTVLTKKMSEVTSIIEVRNMCVVCQEHIRDTLFTPCRHYNCCSQCSNKITKCPTCRSSISNKEMLYQS